MTIEFYMNRKDIAAWKKHILTDFKKMRKKLPRDRRKKFDKDMAYHRKRLKITKVRVVSARKLDRSGGRRIGGRERAPIKRGEVGYVFSWRGMKKDAGLQKVRR